MVIAVRIAHDRVYPNVDSSSSVTNEIGVSRLCRNTNPTPRSTASKLDAALRPTGI